MMTVISGLLISCGPKPGTGIEKDNLCLPHDLIIDSTGNGYALVAWHPGCPGVRILRGFNIYASPVPIVSEYPGAELPPTIKPINEQVYPGDTLGNHDRETYALEAIRNATAYYVHVRAVYSDGGLSPPTNEVGVVTFAQGRFTLRESYTGSHDGFSLVADGYCRTDDPENDLYFYHKDGRDYLCSPSRIGAIYRNTKIYAAGMTAPDNWAEMRPNDLFQERVPIREGEVFILITPEGYPARLKAERIEGSGDARAITFDYIYKPRVAEMPSTR